MDSFRLLLLAGFFIFVRSAEIENARAIVTGGARGIGYATAYDLLRNGAQVVAILDIDVAVGAMATQKLIDQFGENRAVFFPTDVSDSTRFEKDFYMAVQSMGGLDIMINNAGIVDDTIWEQEIDTNFKGVVRGTLMSLDVMGKHKGGEGGTIVNIASIAALIVDKFVPVYDSTKYAVFGFSADVALSYDVTGVAVKTMCPGFTNTRLTRSRAYRFFDFINYAETTEFLENLDLQEPEDVSGEIIRLIEEAPNGAIWEVEKDQPTISIDIPYYRDRGTPV